MINEAAINAVKEGREFVSQKDLFAAVEQVLVGKEKKDRILSKEEKRTVAYHEVGSCADYGIKEKCRAGAEDYNCTAYNGFSRLRHAGA